MNLNYISFPAEIVKSGEEKNGRIPITIIPSRPTYDKVNEKILLKAFDDDCIEGYLKDGILDYDHLSIRGKDDVIKAMAIIGEPEELFIDKEKGVPVCHGVLFKGNPFVDNAILPALNNKSKRAFGASLGGRVLRKSSSLSETSSKKFTDISKIMLKHIAITPLQRAIHSDTIVELRKSFGDEEQLEASFSSFDELIKSMEDDAYFEKAIQAGSVTDIANLSGGQVLQNQSLEGGKIDKRKLKATLPFVLEDVLNGRVGNTYQDFKNRLIKKSFNNKEADEMIKLIAIKSPSIIKLTF